MLREAAQHSIYKDIYHAFGAIEYLSHILPFFAVYYVCITHRIQIIISDVLQ